MSCGCGEPDNDHGNPDHITRERMERAARAAGVDIEQAADNIHDSARQLTGQAGAPGSSGTPPGDAGTRQDRGIRS
jgi:hypothetical protein